MARDHRKLRVFHESHQLTIAIYKETRDFPKDEWFGLRAQMRRAAVSIPSNLVEGSARRSTKEYLNFCNIARGSGSEIGYLVDLAFELRLLSEGQHRELRIRYENLIPQLESLVRRLDALARARAKRNVSPETPLKPKA